MANNVQVLQEYEQMSVNTTRQITGSYREWTAFLATAGRVYKDVCCKG